MKSPRSTSHGRRPAASATSRHCSGQCLVRVRVRVKVRVRVRVRVGPAARPSRLATPARLAPKQATRVSPGSTCVTQSGVGREGAIRGDLRDPAQCVMHKASQQV